MPQGSPLTPRAVILKQLKRRLKFTEEKLCKKNGLPFPDTEGGALRRLRELFMGSVKGEEDAAEAVADLVMDEDDDEADKEEEMAALMNTIPDHLRGESEIALVDGDIPDGIPNVNE